jgi:hypothetical protein
MKRLTLIWVLGCSTAFAAEPVVPVLESRFGLAGSGPGSSTSSESEDDPGLAFVSPRNLFGVEFEAHPNIHGQFLVNLVPMPDPMDEGAGNPPAHIWDAYIDADILSDAQLTIRSGVQPSNFGSSEYFSNASSPYLLVGPHREDIAVIAGLNHSRDLGVRAMGEVADGRASWDVMVLNGAGHLAPEDNTPKDISGRLGTAIGEHISLTGSGQRHVDGEEGERVDWSWSTMAEWRSDNLRLMAEYIGGRIGPESTEVLVGAQSAVAWDLHPSDGLVERWSLTGRWGHFDPHAKTQDADAWMLFDGCVQQWWDSDSSAQVMSGLGYGVFMPMDLTAPVEHSAVIELLIHL